MIDTAAKGNEQENVTDKPMTNSDRIKGIIVNGIRTVNESLSKGAHLSVAQIPKHIIPIVK